MVRQRVVKDWVFGVGIAAFVQFFYKVATWIYCLTTFGVTTQKMKLTSERRKLLLEWEGHKPVLSTRVTVLLNNEISYGTNGDRLRIRSNKILHLSMN